MVIGGRGCIVRLPEQHYSTAAATTTSFSSPHLTLPLCRSQFRRQKRWWSAYLLFYERKDFSSTDGPTGSEGCACSVTMRAACMSCDSHVMCM